MRPRVRYLFLAAALGAAVAVIPAVASSEAGPTVSGLESIMWSPAEVTVASGGTVSFQNSSGSVPHGVVWETGDPETPACSGVPGEGQTNWKGSCSFTKPGTYRYYCSVHGMAMSGTVVVGAPATTPAPVPTAPVTLGGVAPSPPTSTGESTPGTGTASPLAGAAAKAIRLAGAQRGRSVRGSVEISAAGAGARLEVDLLANAATLTAAGRSAKVRVGGLVRSSLRPGSDSFAAPLSRKGRAALRRRGRLALTVRITLTPTRGAAVSVTRIVVMHV